MNTYKSVINTMTLNDVIIQNAKECLIHDADKTAFPVLYAEINPCFNGVYIKDISEGIF